MLDRKRIEKIKAKNMRKKIRGGGKYNIYMDDERKQDKQLHRFSINLEKNLCSLTKEFEKEDICILTVRDVSETIKANNKRFPSLSINKDGTSNEDVGLYNIMIMMAMAVSSIERRYRVLGEGREYTMDDIGDTLTDIYNGINEIVDVAYDKNQTFGELFINIGRYLRDRYKFTKTHLTAYFRIFNVELEFNDEKKLG